MPGFENGDDATDRQLRWRLITSVKVGIHEPVAERRRAELVEFETGLRRVPWRTAGRRPRARAAQETSLSIVSIGLGFDFTTFRLLVRFFVLVI